MKSPTIPPEVPCTDGDELEAAKSLLAVYEGLASLPLDCASGDVKSIVRAIKDDRLRDAVDLIDVSCELDALDLSVEEDIECPMENAAQTWRYDWRARSTRSGVRLRSIDGAKPVALKPVRAMAIRHDRRWIAEVGDLPAFGRASLDAGLKGELVVVLFSGALTIVNDDDEVVGELSVGEDGYATRHHVFCREQNNAESLGFEFIVRGNEQVRGIWCLSTSRTLSDDDRRNDPHTKDVFIARDLLPFGDAAADGGAFCPGATPCSSEEYPHKDIVEMGGLDRASLDKEAFAVDGGWSIDHPEKCTAIITGVQAGKAAGAIGVGNRRKLVAHGPGVELIVSLRGVTWVAVTNEKSGNSEARSKYEMSHDVDDPTWLPAYVTGLVAPGGSGHDVMLLNASYHHTAWTQPDSDARFLHVFFPDPREIALYQKGVVRSRSERPVAKPRKTASGRLLIHAEPAAAGVTLPSGWLQASSCHADRPEAAILCGPWARPDVERRKSGAGVRANSPRVP